MSKRVWKAMGIVLAVVLVGSISVAVMAQQGPEEPVNTLRLYGEGSLSAAFPYTQFDGPFNLKSPEAPPKDFLVWNPAYFYHMDAGLNRQIKTDGVNANQKVHLRQWYVPSLTQPLGDTWTTDAETGAHIVFEYTYLLLDTDNNPVAGSPQAAHWRDWWEWETAPVPTAFAFPMADRTAQIGLDSFDADGDGIDDIVTVVDTNQGPYTWGADLNLATGEIALQVGDEIQFLDHKVVVTRVDADHNEVAVDVYYTGYGGEACGYEHALIGSRVLRKSRWDWVWPEFAISSGRHSISFDDPQPVTRPWYFRIDDVVGDTVVARAGRLLNRGESFFVDGAEYAVAAIDTVGGEPSAPFRSITIRNPLPKGDGTVQLRAHSVWKCEVDEYVHIPFMPPFNMTHDIIDDVNATLDTAEMEPDQQADEEAGAIAARRVQDQPPVVAYYIDQDVEERFDTNLLEEKFLVETEWYTVTHFVEWETTDLYRTDPPDVVGPVNNPNYKGAAENYFANPDTNDTDVRFEDVSVYCEMYEDADGDGQYEWHPLTIRAIDQENGRIGTEEYYLDDCRELAVSYHYLWQYKQVVDQPWQWINIETNPQAYTEFVLPEMAGVTPGDYLLVSSFITQDSDQTWYTWQHGTNAAAAEVAPRWNEHSIRVKFYYDAEVGFVNSADVYVNDAEYNLWRHGVDANSLRIYGRDSEDAATPYWDLTGPFDITSDQMPQKDFLVWSPAFFDHDEFPEIVVNENDANEKVFLKTWYVPTLYEPVGRVWTDQTPITSPHIVNEYTYFLMDTANNPIAGQPGQTRFKFPVANQNPAQLGLDSFDATGDGLDNAVNYEREWFDEEVGRHSVLLTTELIEVQEGDVIRFLDHWVEFNTVDAGFFPDEGAVVVGTWYDGFKFGEAAVINPATVVRDRQTLSAGRHTVQAFEWNEGEPVFEPWLLTVHNVLNDPAGDVAYVTVSRWLQEDESFFVNGLEYYVAKLGLENASMHPWGAWQDLKYITLRNPICKGDGTVELDALSVHKTCVPRMELLPFLPPFNMDHNIVDDVDVILEGYVEGEPDEQGPDTSDISARVGPTGPVEVYYIDQTVEPRFDTALGEEKFTEGNEWQWINIETQPWSYTEFVLPDIPNYGGGTGDYILVSSWLTEDSASTTHGEGAVRMKFAYDPLDGTGIYVNHIGDIDFECIDPVIISLTADPEVVELGDPILFEAEVEGTPPLRFEWDFGDGETATTAMAEVTHTYAEVGTYTVTLTLTGHECSDVVAEETIEVEVTEPVVEPEFHIFLPIITNNFTP